MRKFLIYLIISMLLVFMVPDPTQDAGGEDTRSNGNYLFVSETGSTWSVIQRAIENATTGDKIYISPGNYSVGFLLIKDDISIIGNHTSGDVNIRYPGSEVIVGVSSDNSTISGLNIVEDGGHIYNIMIGQSRNTTLSNISVFTDLSHAMHISDCSDILFENLTIDSGERRSMEIRDVERLRIEGFRFSSEGSPDAVKINGESTGLEFIDGEIYMDDSNSVPFRAEGVLKMYLDEVNTTYQHEFINMERGDVVCYDTFFGYEDVRIRSGSVNDTFKSYVRKEIFTRARARDGSLLYASGVELNITPDIGSSYRTPYYGGSASVSDDLGSFNSPFTLMNFNHTGGEFSYTIGSVSLESFYPDADMNGQIKVEEIDLTDNDPVILEFEDIWYINGSVEGQALYDGGPLDGAPVINGTIVLIAYEGSLDTDRMVDNTSKQLFREEVITNSSGHFVFTDIAFGHDMEMEIIPPDSAKDGGNMSGYMKSSIFFDHHMTEVSDDDPLNSKYEYDMDEPYPETVLELISFYHEYVPPSTGPISGVVRFGDKGPLANEHAPDTTVLLYNISGDIVRETTSDANGNYSFSDVPFGEEYEIKAIPPEEHLGINNNQTGYLFWDGSAFNHTGETFYNISLKYYNYIPPTTKHPKVAIISGNNEPLEGVRVTMKISGEEYVAYTNADGVAEFDEIEGITFPDGATFRADMEGYETIEWDLGDGIPKMEEEQGPEDDTLLIWVLIGMIVAVLIIGAILATRKKRAVQPEE